MAQDPANISYRVNAANVLLAAQQEKNAIGVLQQALKVAKSPQEVAVVQNAIEAVQKSQATRQEVEEANRRFQQEMESASSETQTSAEASDSKSSDAGRQSKSRQQHSTIVLHVCHRPIVREDQSRSLLLERRGLMDFTNCGRCIRPSRYTT